MLGRAACLLESRTLTGGKDRSGWEARLPFANPVLKLLSPEISKSSNRKKKKVNDFIFSNSSVKFFCNWKIAMAFYSVDY